MKIPIAFTYKFVKLLGLLNTSKSGPPKSMMYFIGKGGPDDIGAKFVEYFKQYGGLKSTHKILDVGCGAGRMALPLTNFLTSGHYEGFDLFKDGIMWCKKNISSKFSNFNFKIIDLYNKNYNPNGKIKPSKLKFPYSQNTFDFVCANSIFTHIPPGDFEHYISEIKNILNQGGTFFCTFFIMNSESQELINKKQTSLYFQFFDGNEFATLENKLPEHAIAYKEKYIKKILEKNGFKDIIIHYGNWCNRKKFLDSQDIIIATKS